MALTPSTMLPLGTPLPSFSLPDAVSGGQSSAADLAGRPVLVMFICNHCPYVVHVRDELTRLGTDYADGPLAIVAINSNSLETHPQDGPEAMATMARDLGWRFAYAFDESQEVAHAFRAACTPEFYLFDGAHRLAYRGQLDDSRPGNSHPVTGADLRAAIAAVLAGETPSPAQVPSVGCNIKWHPGRAPAYFG